MAKKGKAKGHLGRTAILVGSLSLLAPVAPVSAMEGNNSVSQQSAKYYLTGSVVDNNGDPVIGAVVKVNGKVVAVTDADGHYNKETSILDTIQFCPCFAVSGLARACFCSKPA